MNAPAPHLALRLVVMGVSGAGKSTLAGALADRLGATLVEGDDLHSAANRAAMQRGVALQDDDRWPWLDRIADAIDATPGDVIATCSALKRRYRDRLRAAVPGLRFVCLTIAPPDAERRVAARVGQTFLVSLVATQFEAFEAPFDEPDVLTLPADTSTASQVEATRRWAANSP